MQMSGKRACSYLPECILSYYKDTHLIRIIAIYLPHYYNKSSTMLSDMERLINFARTKLRFAFFTGGMMIYRKPYPPFLLT